MSLTCGNCRSSISEELSFGLLCLVVLEEDGSVRGETDDFVHPNTAICSECLPNVSQKDANEGMRCYRLACRSPYLPVFAYVPGRSISQGGFHTWSWMSSNWDRVKFLSPVFVARDFPQALEILFRDALSKASF